MGLQSEGAADLSPEKLSTIGLANLGAVYLAWGSTYLAIRVAVREGSGFPPFAVGFSRLIVAGLLLMLWGWLSGNSLRISRRELGILAGSGLLLWLGGNGLVMLAEQRADSGLAALVIGTAPLWAAIMESLLDRRVPSPLLLGSVVLGFVGIGVLSAPILLNGVRADALSVIALVAASIFWTVGAVWQQRESRIESARVRSAYQHLSGAIGFLALTLIMGEPRPSPTAEAWAGWGYLVVFGSLVGFTSFISALRLLPVNVAMTYAYVNPVIAVILGAIILGESITAWTIAGAVLIILGVAGVFRNRGRSK
jgi:drug/metabolite transporter (DMT)-like permease